MALGHDHPLWAGVEPTIYNVTLTSADTEYPQALPGNTRKIAVIPRDPANSIKMAFTSGASGTTYVTVDSRTYFDDLISMAKPIVYLQSGTAGAVVEIIAWN